MSTAPAGATPVHPLADPQAAQRALEALPAHDPRLALEELARWQESVAVAQDLKPARKVDLLLAIDAAARPRVDQLQREYLAAGRPSPAAESRLWAANHDYWMRAGEAFVYVLETTAPDAVEAQGLRERQAALIMHALRCLGQRIKWTHFRYGPVDVTAWGAFNRGYAHAEARRLADTKAIFPGEESESSPRLEFLRGAMLAAISPNSLLPQAIEIADRVIAAHAARFELAQAPAADLPYWIDLDQPMAPQRAMRAPRAAAGLRFFGAGAALEDLTELGGRLDTMGELPLARAGLGSAADAPTLLEVMRHLAANWSSRPPERRHMRHVARARLSVAHGFDGVMRALQSDAASHAEGGDMESWVVEDVSAGGFGASVPQIGGDWLRVGALLAMQPEGARNWVVGVVRRVTRTEDRQARVGIQTLSNSPWPAEFSLDGGRERGVLLKSGDLRSSEALIALRPGVFASGQELRTERAGKRCLYRPQGIVERGADYELLHCRELEDAG